MDSASTQVRLVDAILNLEKKEYRQASSGQINVQPPQVGGSSTKRSADDMEEPEQGPATKKHKSLGQTINDFIEEQAPFTDGRHDNHYWPTDPATGQLVPEEEMGFNTPPPMMLRQWGNPDYKSGLEGSDAEMLMTYRGHDWIEKHLHAPAPAPESAPAAKKGRARKTGAASKDKKGKGKATDKPQSSLPPSNQRRGRSKAAPKPKTAKKTPAPKGGRGQGRPRKEEDLSVAGKASKKTIAKKTPAAKKPAAPSTHAMRTRSRGPVDQ